MRSRSPGKQGGAAAVLVALVLLFFLVAVGGLVIDLGRLFINKTELQNAVDACALAAARELNVDFGSLSASEKIAVLTRAENAGITVGNRHRSDFHNEQVQLVTEQDVTFAATLNEVGSPKSQAPENVRYVRCSHAVEGILRWFPQADLLVKDKFVWTGGSNAIKVTAVASLQGGAKTCVFPLGMCSQTDTPPQFGLVKGVWYSGRFDAGGAMSGSFNWIDFDPHGGGARDLADVIAGPGLCELEVGSIVKIHEEPGLMNVIEAPWNSRFGLYKNGGKYDLTSAPPDHTGYAYGPTNLPEQREAYGPSGACATHGNCFPDMQLASPPVAFPARAVTGLPKVEPPYRPSSPEEHGTHGADRRVVSLPVVKCSELGPAKQATVQGWACALMVKPFPPATEEVTLEYLGPPGAEGVPCATYGQSGGPGGTGPRVPTLVQ